MLHQSQIDFVTDIYLFFSCLHYLFENAKFFSQVYPGQPIRRWFRSDSIGSDHPTESYRIPGDGIA